MAFSTMLEQPWQTTLMVASPFVAVAILLSLTRLYTTIIYHQSLQNFSKENRGGQQILRSPQIPYTLPWLGNALSFLSKTPGSFWEQLLSWYPVSTGICTLLVAGRKVHVLFSPTAVQALFRAKAPSRDEFEREMYAKVFLMPPDQIENAVLGKHFEHEMNSRYLTNFERVNELTSQYTKVLQDVLDRDGEVSLPSGPTGIYGWLRDKMFEASVTALMGERILEIYPAYGADFFEFECTFMAYFFDTPSFLMQKAIATRGRIFRNLEDWSRKMYKESGGAPVDPEGPAWEPVFGSRLNRARQIDYSNRKLNTRTAAALDLGITFALASNIIPSVGWMLFHLLDPAADSKLLVTVIDEIKASHHADGTVDVPRLMSQPVLQSVWNEILRLYADVLVTRTLPEDLILPIDEDGKHHVRLAKNDQVFVPTWVSHRESTNWSTSSSTGDFDPYRFVTRNEKTGEYTFNMGRAGGKFFPFGGGKTICPGRAFAKQEALGTLAVVLMRFEFEVIGYLDDKSKACKRFPVPAQAFPGSGSLMPGGDVTVRIKKRGL